jgi:hypothetical protein
MIKLIDILSEIIDPSEAYNDTDAVQTLIDGKRNLAFIVEKSNNKDNWARIQKMIADNGLKAMYVKGNTNNAYVVYTPGSESKANELKDIAETYDGYLSANATKEDTIKIGELLGYDYDKIMAYVDKNFPKTEARVTPVGMTRILPQADTPFINKLTETFGEGDSGFNLYEPASGYYELEYYEDDGDEETYNKFKNFLSKYTPGTILLSNDILAANFFPCPGAPKNSYSAKITIGKDKDIHVESPYLDSEGDSSVGWFDTSGKYHADTKNFNEDGYYIGGVQEARVTPVGMSRILPKEDVALAKEFIDLYEVGDIEYNFEPDGPIKMEYYPDEHDSVKILMSKHKPGTVFLSNDIGGIRPDPKAPRNSFTNKIIIDEDKIIIEFIHCDEDTDCQVGMGWFDFNGKYHNIDA